MTVTHPITTQCLIDDIAQQCHGDAMRLDLRLIGNFEQLGLDSVGKTGLQLHQTRPDIGNALRVVIMNERHKNRHFAITHCELMSELLEGRLDTCCATALSTKKVVFTVFEYATYPRLCK